jgi:hypothetical protein
VFAELFGVADSSAAFGVGMTRTLEQDDPESFSANRFSRIKFVAVTARLEAEPFQKATIARVFQQPVKPSHFETPCDPRLSVFTSFQITFLLLAGASETRSRRHSAALL